ncbi:wax ester/triacylglycerol synthase family O-acyltransferase [Terrabacter aeriphilus]|uniref:diacylglycerol O-acyltransferase n=2 Tax=Terrabacter aeriphilus TaxID=515662 RepID=A0ABP9J9U8_9MICO
MGSADSLWLTMDRPTNLMVITSVVLLESRPDWDAVLDVLRTRLVDPHPVFRERSRHRRRPFGAHRWEEDPDFDLAHHVHRATLSGAATDGGGGAGSEGSEGGAGSESGAGGQADAELQAYVEEHLPRPFDRSRPLWEVHLVDGPGAGAALVFRIHHALADGIALTRVLLGLTEDADGVPGDLVGPGPTPGIAALPVAALPLGQAGKTRGGVLAAGLRLARAGLRSSRMQLRDKGAHRVVVDAATATATVALRTGQVVGDVLLTSNPESAVGGVPGHRKRVLWTAPLPLTGLKQVGRLVGATLNDVLLSAVAGALHTYQRESGRSPVDLATMVPVDVRPLDEPLPRELGNRFALLFLRFPSGDATPLGRLAVCKARMDWLKASPEAALTFGLLSVIGRVPAGLQRRFVDFFADKAIGVTTNVAGPREPRRLAGVPVTGVLGWVPGSGRHTVGFCIVTYDGAVRIGIMADDAEVPEPERLLTALEDEVALLVRIGAAGTDDAAGAGGAGAARPGGRGRRSPHRAAFRRS